ncbi:DUF3987 domain-containing protein [Halocola ammonii]
MTSNNTFNPEEWCGKANSNNSKDSHQKASGAKAGSEEFKKVESMIYQLEAQEIDLAPNYEEWRNIGFAFADEFGEEGRELFQRVSKFYSEYSETECDKQYTHCLSAKGSGVSLGTFYHLAKQAGLEMPQKPRRKNGEKAMLPTFSEEIYSSLPDFLKRVVKMSTSDEERDILLLGAITVISSCLPKVHGLYDGRKVRPNLFLFVTGEASAGKGRLSHCRQLVKPIHDGMRDKAAQKRQEYEKELAAYNSQKGAQMGLEKPAEPAENMLFIPANNSTTGVFQLLSDNDGRGLIYETEGDTLAQAFKTDYGNYSDGFRKAFHHETISFFRRTNREYVDIESPCLSALLSGTPKQISSLIPGAENGLFSRFMFYYMNVKPIWKDVFANSGSKSHDEYFDDLGLEFQVIYEQLLNAGEKEFTLTKDQQKRFNEFFQKVQAEFLKVQGIDYIATVRRLGIIAFRLCMVLSSLRAVETGVLTGRVICRDQDFNAAIGMIDNLLIHSSQVFNKLPQEQSQPNHLNRKEKFLAALPFEFNRQDFLSIAQKLSIPGKTAERYITQACKKGLILRDRQNEYQNPAAEETEDDEETED